MKLDELNRLVPDSTILPHDSAPPHPLADGPFVGEGDKESVLVHWRETQHKITALATRHRELADLASHLISQLDEHNTAACSRTGLEPFDTQVLSTMRAVFKGKVGEKQVIEAITENRPLVIHGTPVHCGALLEAMTQRAELRAAIGEVPMPHHYDEHGKVVPRQLPGRRFSLDQARGHVRAPHQEPFAVLAPHTSKGCLKAPALLDPVRERVHTYQKQI